MDLVLGGLHVETITPLRNHPLQLIVHPQVLAWSSTMCAFSSQGREADSAAALTDADLSVPEAPIVLLYDPEVSLYHFCTS